MEARTICCFLFITLFWFIAQTLGKTVKHSEMKPPAPTPIRKPIEAEDTRQKHIIAAKLSFYFNSRKRRDADGILESSGSGSPAESGSGIESGMGGDCGSGMDSSGDCGVEITPSPPDVTEGTLVTTEATEAQDTPEPTEPVTDTITSADAPETPESTTAPEVTTSKTKEDAETPESTASPPELTTSKQEDFIPLGNRTLLPDIELLVPESKRPADKVPLVLFSVPVHSSQSSEIQNICIDWPAAGTQGWYRAFKFPGLDIRTRLHRSSRGGTDLILYGVEVFSGSGIHVYASKYGMRINREVFRWGAVHRGSRILLTKTTLRIRLQNEASLVIHRTEIEGKPTLLLEMKDNESYEISTLGFLGFIRNWRGGYFGPENTPVLIDQYRRLAHPLMEVKVNDMQCQVPQSSLETILRTPIKDFQLSNGMFLHRF